jgi:thiamine kinase-like enzyme
MNEPKPSEFSAFTNSDGSNYRKEGKIDIPKLSVLLDQISIKPIKLIQLWRNVTGKVEYEGETRFFKMASTEAISQKLENEVLWNNFANTSLTKLNLKVPNIIKSGKMNELSYYFSEFVEGRPLAEKWEKGEIKPKIYNLHKYLPEIAEFAAELQNKSCMNLPNQDTQAYKLSENRTLLEIGEEILLKKIESWLQPENLIMVSLEYELNIIKENISNWKFCINHSDFVPWHILESNTGQLYLIDGEHASLKPDFYDIAYFYQRTFTQAERPDLANEFLQLTYSKLNQEKQKLFIQQFPSVLAARIIGGYFDAVNDKQADLKFHHQLKNLWEEEEILSF